MIPSGEIFPENNKGLLLDGRNRAEAWDRFPPTLAINLKRRHRSKGQKAMAQAIRRRVPQRKRGDAGRGGEMLQRYLQMLLIIMAMILASIVLWKVFGPIHHFMPE
jgi:hypothetical protein